MHSERSCRVFRGRVGALREVFCACVLLVMLTMASCGAAPAESQTTAARDLPAGGPVTTETATSPIASPTTPAPITTLVSPTTVAATSPSKPIAMAQNYQGSGDEILEIGLADEPRIVTFACPECTGRTVLKTDGDGRLASIEGPYTGRHIIDLNSGGTDAIEIHADAEWTFIVEDIRVLKESPRLTGHGDDVILLPEGTTRATITHSGQSNFHVLAFGEGVDNLVNEIGEYSGTVLLSTPAIVEINADGDWSIAPA